MPHGFLPSACSTLLNNFPVFMCHVVLVLCSPWVSLERSCPVLGEKNQYADPKETSLVNPLLNGEDNLCLSDLGFQDLLHFSSKGQFEEAGQAPLNGLDQPEQTPVPPETPSALDPQPESHPLQLHPHEPTVAPTQSTITENDMRRAKRIRVSKGHGSQLGLCAFSLSLSYQSAQTLLLLALFCASGLTCRN